MSASEQICCYVFKEIMLILEDAFSDCARVMGWGGGGGGVNEAVGTETARVSAGQGVQCQCCS